MFECPKVIKHDNARDSAFLAVSKMECVKDGEKGFAVYGIWIIIGQTRDFLSENGMVFISNKDLDNWKEYVPRESKT
jgi:hypothetical protein